MIPLLFLLAATAKSELSFSDMLGIGAFMISVGGIIFSAGIQRAQITQNAKDIAAIKNKEETGQEEKLKNAVAYEKRLTNIESKLDILIELETSKKQAVNGQITSN